MVLYDPIRNEISKICMRICKEMDELDDFKRFEFFRFERRLKLENLTEDLKFVRERERD